MMKTSGRGRLCSDRQIKLNFPGRWKRLSIKIQLTEFFLSVWLENYWQYSKVSQKYFTSLPAKQYKTCQPQFKFVIIA